MPLYFIVCANILHIESAGRNNMGSRIQHRVITLLLLGLIGLTSGCATTQINGAPDPIEPANRVFFNINETLDKHLLKPIAETYVNVTPKLMRTSVTNFFDNLTYLNVILNAFLQGKLDQGLSDATRFLFNSTIGIAGLFDVATPMGLPEHDEDLGQTLAVWGLGKGAFLYIPLDGPNTIRNTPDFVSSTLLNPLFYVTNTILFPISALHTINKRANLLEASNIRDEAAIDPYTFTREAYLQQRDFLIYDGNPPVEGYDDIFDVGGEESGSGGVLVIE
jgi:ABC-type transporter lipoprotein component MlaA